jgi:acetoin utilization deacetylase AcuC-like enzyme
MTYAVVTDPICARHDFPGHPESQRRLDLALSGVPKNVRRLGPAELPRSVIERSHDPGYLAWLERICLSARPVTYIDSDTYLTSSSFDVASAAAGSACTAVNLTLEGEHAFSLMRPPGHHAERSRAMGFCLINNAAVAAAWALRSVDRVAIVDWDVHHGNGTQHIFYGTDRVLYCSVHQWNAFPYSGSPDERGVDAGIGYTINAPLSSGSTIADYALVLSEIFAPAIEEFSPEACIVSAGQDILADDPLGSMAIRPEDCALLTSIVREAAGVPLALVLEGGYGPSHGEAIAAIFRGLAGETDGSVHGKPRQSTKDLVTVLGCGDHDAE